MFTILSPIKKAEFHVSNAVIGRDSLFGYAIYSLADVHCQQNKQHSQTE